MEGVDRSCLRSQITEWVAVKLQQRDNAGGGNSYGYDIVKRIGEDGEYARGERRLNEQEAAVVRRIFTDYVQVFRREQSLPR
jgi:hypothetical protein